MNIVKLFIAALGALFLSSLPTVSAQEQLLLDEPIELSRIVVVTEGRYTPLSATFAYKYHLLSSSAADKNDLRKGLAASSDTAILLNHIPGVSVYNTGGVSGLTAIHGLADDRVRVKIDGMDLVSSCPNHMNPPLSYINPTNVDRIKVYAGITPVSLGGDSIGGTVIADTPAPQFAKTGKGTLVKGKAGTFYRSNGNGISSNLSTTVASDKISVNYTGATAQADNYKAADNFKSTTATANNGRTLELDEVGSTAYETWNHSLGMAFKFDDQLLEAKMGYQDIPYQYFANQRMDMLGNTEYRPSLRYFGEFSWGDLDARVFHQLIDKHYMDFGNDKRFWYGTLSGSNGVPCSPLGTTCAAGMPMYTESNTTGTSLKADIDLSSQDTLRVGNELLFYRLDDYWPPSGSAMWPGTFLNINDGRRDRIALFSEWESQVNDQWLTLLGVRYEHLRMDTGDVAGYNPAGMGNQSRDANNFNVEDKEKTDNNWDLTALTQYKLNSFVDLEMGYARKTRSPNLYERYAWSTWSMAAEMINWFGDGNGYIGDIALEPEIANTLSATLDWHTDDRKWNLKGTPYYTRVTDYIDAIQWNATSNAPSSSPVSNQFSVLKFTNQSARLYGIDLSGAMPIAETEIGFFGLQGLFSYTVGKNRDTNTGLYNIMPVNARLTLSHKYEGWNNGFEAVMVGEKSDVSQTRNEIKTEGYTLFNLRSSYAWKHLRLDFGIENLFDKSYRLPLGGAYTGQGTTMTLNPTDGIMAWGTAVPAMGRNIYTGLTVSF